MVMKVSFGDRAGAPASCCEPATNLNPRRCRFVRALPGTARPAARDGRQFTTRLRNVRVPRYPNSSVPPISARNTAHSGMWPSDGVSTARSPSAM